MKKSEKLKGVEMPLFFCSGQTVIRPRGQNAFPKLITLLLHYSEKLSKNMVFYINLSNSILLGTTAKSNVLTEKITSIFTQSILFILSMILKNNCLFTTENTTIFPCVLLTGSFPLITLILSCSMVNCFKLLFCNASLTNLQNKKFNLANCQNVIRYGVLQNRSTIKYLNKAFLHSYFINQILES